MNRVGLKDCLLNHADDNDLLDCAKAWDSANEYGHLESASKAICGQFADDIAGHGESLDDMCADRSEVASAVQDAHTGERYHEDEQRDNSEIGD